jgi:phosphoglycerate-specific signal transduction histidine kinase
MDPQTIDQEYARLQTEFQDVANTIQSLAQKLQAAAQSGDQNAREWLLDLKQVALDVNDEQMQVNTLLQTIHGFIQNQNQELTQMPAYQQVPVQPQYQRSQGLLGGFLNGGFGRAMEVGAGVGLGETLINDIFN